MRKRFENNQIILYLLLAISLFSVMYLFLLPLTLGCVLALVLEPLVLKVNTKVKNYNQSLKIVLIVLLLVISVPTALLIASGVEAIVNYSQNADFLALEVKFNELTAKSFLQLSPYLNKLGLDFEKIRPSLLVLASKTGGYLLEILQSLAKQAPKIMLDTLVIIFSGYFTLTNKELLSKWLNKNPFIEQDTNSKFARHLHDISYSVILASVVCGLLQMMVMLIAALIAGNSQWLLVAVLSFLFSFVPVVGTAPITVTLVVYSAVNQYYYELIVYLLAISGLFIIDNIIRPLLIGSKAKINPFVAFLAAIGGLNILGFYGLFFGPIVIGVSLAMLKDAWQEEEDPPKSETNS